MEWHEVPDRILDLAEKCAAPAWDIKRELSTVYTEHPVGIHYNPYLDLAGMYSPYNEDGRDWKRCKKAIDRAVGPENTAASRGLRYDEVTSGDWIKVAESKTLRNIAETLNFLPGFYFGSNIKNHASPVAAALTTGLVGAGLGYGAGWLGEKFLPANWRRKRLRRALSILGGALGFGSAVPWMYANLANDKSLFSSWPFERRKEAEDCFIDESLGEPYRNAVKSLVEKSASLFAEPIQAPEATPYDVNINHLGQTLWQSGADSSLRGMTMGAAVAASQMPGGRGPGWATPSQFGRLGIGTGVGALKGAIVGTLIGTAAQALTGMPAGGKKAAIYGGAVLGALRSSVPKLFGD